MSRIITVNPMTRISGFMEIEVNVEHNKVIDAKCSGILFRGLERILTNKSPFDVIYLTERICGICSTAHGVASAMALENAFKIRPNNNARVLRDIMHRWEFIQNHIRHFYLYTIPDFAVTPEVAPMCSIENCDLRLPERINKKILDDYIEAVRISRLAHEALAVLGGKAPHSHGIFIGGVTQRLDSVKLMYLKSLVLQIKEFIINKMLEDVYIISNYYKDYFDIGKGHGNLLSYGVFEDYRNEGFSYLEPGVFLNGIMRPFYRSSITEGSYNTWYIGQIVRHNLFEGRTEPDRERANAHSWVKNTRYEGYHMEVGPLARMILSGNYENKVSVMDRIIARVLETKKVIEIIEGLLEIATFENIEQRAYNIPDSTRGSSLIDTTRGALSHWITIANKKISHYNISTPSAWNCSPTDENGRKGVIEAALIGTEVKNPDKPVEIGRIVRSFDPCISCATHVISDKFKPVEIII